MNKLNKSFIKHHKFNILYGVFGHFSGHKYVTWILNHDDKLIICGVMLDSEESVALAQFSLKSASTRDGVSRLKRFINLGNVVQLSCSCHKANRIKYSYKKAFEEKGRFSLIFGQHLAKKRNHEVLPFFIRSHVTFSARTSTDEKVSKSIY